MSGIEKRIKKHACIFVKDLSFISVRYSTLTYIVMDEFLH